MHTGILILNKKHNIPRQYNQIQYPALYYTNRFIYFVLVAIVEKKKFKNYYYYKLLTLVTLEIHTVLHLTLLLIDYNSI